MCGSSCLNCSQLPAIPIQDLPAHDSAQGAYSILWASMGGSMHTNALQMHGLGTVGVAAGKEESHAHLQ